MTRLERLGVALRQRQLARGGLLMGVRPLAPTAEELLRVTDWLGSFLLLLAVVATGEPHGLQLVSEVKDGLGSLRWWRLDGRDRNRVVFVLFIGPVEALGWGADVVFVLLGLLHFRLLLPHFGERLRAVVAAVAAVTVLLVPTSVPMEISDPAASGSTESAA